MCTGVIRYRTGASVVKLCILCTGVIQYRTGASVVKLRILCTGVIRYRTGASVSSMKLQLLLASYGSTFSSRSRRFSFSKYLLYATASNFL